MIANFSKNQIILIIASFIIVIAGVTLPVYFFNRTVGNTIYPNTFIDGIDMGRKSKKEAAALLERRDDYLNDVEITILYDEAPIATYSAEELNIHRDIQTKVDQAYIVGRTPHLTSRIYQQINSMFGINSIGFKTNMTYDKDPVKEFVANTADSYDKPPKNALFTFENGKVTSFKADEKGREIQQDAFLEEFNKQVSTISKSKTKIALTLKDKVIEPEITLAKANERGIEELVAEGQSDYTHSIPSRIHNVILAASKFNGVIIPKGEEFSFNDIIGDISARTGYQTAYVISGGSMEIS